MEAWNSYLTAYSEAIKLFKIVIGELALFFLILPVKQISRKHLYLLLAW